MIARDYNIMHCKDGNLYINFNNGADFRSDDSKRLSTEDLGEIKTWIEQNNEYVRKDTFMKKAFDWLKDYCSYEDYNGKACLDEELFKVIVEDFKKHMEK